MIDQDLDARLSVEKSLAVKVERREDGSSGRGNKAKYLKNDLNMTALRHLVMERINLLN